MKFLPMLTEEEIRYICSVIPLQESVNYFKHNSKNFSKVMPGYRATSLKTQEQVGVVLFKNRKEHFISSYIESHITRWINEIGTAMTERIDKKESREVALLNTLPHSYFVNNIGLYFKLTAEEHCEEFVTILGASIKMIKEYEVKRRYYEFVLNDKSSEIEQITLKLDSIRQENSTTNQNLTYCQKEVRKLKCDITELLKLKKVVQAKEQTIGSTKQKLLKRDQLIKEQKADLAAVKKEYQLLKEEISKGLWKQQNREYQKREVTHKPRRPKDIEEFKEFLGYNLVNIGMQTQEDFYFPLIDYLSKVLFQGKPVVISRNTGKSLMKCVSNALVNTSMVPTLEYSADIIDESIDSFLSQELRIACLDNFLGNYNETTLLAICEKHKDKIIFLTVSYDGTLNYVADELMKYCHYVNLNRIEAFVKSKELTEDPSIIDEIEASDLALTSDPRWSGVLKRMLTEFGFRGALTLNKAYLVADEISLCQLLAFDILPYCLDVLRIAPFNTSETLVKYAGNGGRCQYGDLLGRWFTS